MPSPNATSTAADNEMAIGVLNQQDALYLDMPDEEVGRLIKNRVKNAIDYWDEKLDLTKIRDTNEKYWLNSAFDADALYDYQVPYKDNRIFQDVETLLPMVNARTPQPIVTEAHDTAASRELANDLQNTLITLYEDLQIKGVMTMVLRHLLIGYRIGCVKYSYDAGGGPLDENGDPMGEIVANWVRPQKLILDEGADNVDDIPLIGEVVTNTAEELCLKFPDKKDDIYRDLGFVKGTRSQLGKKIGYHEIWFSYYDTKGIKREATSWQLNNRLLLGKMKNPNWNYDEWGKDGEGNAIRLNYFKRPKKPYVLFNFLNLGETVIDETSLTEQASNQQDILNKRGRQIVENGDSANSGMVLNSEMISVDDVAKITGDPLEKVVVKGNVQQAATRLPVNLLPEYVVNDKMDARNEIDNIFGTHAPTRGERSKLSTLGQEVLSQRSDMGRTQTPADAMEAGATRLYQGLTQMMKVFWDKPQPVQYTGADGKTAFWEFGREMVEDGVKVRVKAGTIVPDDRFTKREETLKAIAILDPMSIAEGLGKTNPKEFAKRIVFYKYDMQRYLTEVLQDAGDGNIDQDAIDHIAKINGGQGAKPADNPTKEHLATHEAYIRSIEFGELEPEVRQLHFAHVRQELDKAKASLQMQDQGAAAGSPPVAEATPGAPAAGAPGPAGNKIPVVPQGGAMPVPGAVMKGGSSAPTMFGGGNVLQALMARFKQ